MSSLTPSYELPVSTFASLTAPAMMGTMSQPNAQSLGQSLSFSQPALGVPTPFTQSISPTLYQTVTPSPRATLGEQSIQQQASVPMLNTGVVASPLGTPLATMVQGSPRMARNEQVDEMVENYRAEMGDEEQLASFFNRYSSHDKMSDKCYLDGRYFWKVLAPYPGLVASEMFMRIDITELVKNPETGTIDRHFNMSEPVIDVSEIEEVKGAQTRYRLIKLLIDISDDRESTAGAVHANLVYIDVKSKEVVRFEPMMVDEFTDPINTVLQGYFQKILPDYSFRMLDEHPQLPSTETCPSKGMCSAYVLKKAMMLVTGMDRPLNDDPRIEELKIMHFADAIETEYGGLPEADVEIEAGFGLTLSSGPTMMYPAPGAVLTLGSAFYPPPRYGYIWGPRYGRRPGWGWGRRRHAIWGKQDQAQGQQDPSTWNKIKGKLQDSYKKAKSKLKSTSKKVAARKSSKQSDDVPTFDEFLSNSDEETQKNLGIKSGPYRRQRYEYGNHYHKAGGCGCMGCMRAQPRNEHGYWNRSEYGCDWKKVNYAGGRPEYGCGCGIKPRTEYGWDPKSWQSQTKTGVAGSIIGAGAGALLGGGFRGALLGGLAGGAGGYLLGSAGSSQQQRYNYQSPPPQYQRW